MKNFTISMQQYVPIVSIFGLDNVHNHTIGSQTFEKVLLSFHHVVSKVDLEERLQIQLCWE